MLCCGYTLLVYDADHIPILFYNTLLVYDALLVYDYSTGLRSKSYSNTLLVYDADHVLHTSQAFETKFLWHASGAK